MHTIPRNCVLDEGISHKVKVVQPPVIEFNAHSAHAETKTKGRSEYARASYTNPIACVLSLWTGCLRCPGVGDRGPDDRRGAGNDHGSCFISGGGRQCRGCNCCCVEADAEP